MKTKTLSQSENVNQYLQNRKKKEIKVKSGYIKSRGQTSYLCNSKMRRKEKKQRVEICFRETQEKQKNKLQVKKVIAFPTQ